jgi:hypothetical protein
MISSTIPSAKYSCSGSPLIFWNRSTAIEGLSGSASCGFCYGPAVTFRSDWVFRQAPHDRAIGVAISAACAVAFPPVQMGVFF